MRYNGVVIDSVPTLRTVSVRGGGRDVHRMTEVKIGKNESLDNALRRFKKQCQRSGILAELRKHEHYDKPSVKRKKKSEAARKKKKLY